ncbi:nitric oxide synthase oxygenase [Staphylococcus aureus]|nr:nitric oxide synthase oxygenase [Staphylococcus aureus]
MLFKEAQAFIENMYKECHYETQIINKRLHDIELEIKETGTYTHTEEDLFMVLKWLGVIQIVALVVYFGFVKCH